MSIWWRLRLPPRRWLLVGILLAVLAGAVVLVTTTSDPAVVVSAQFVPGVAEVDGSPVRIDTTLYLPAKTPAPAILLAHGFGASKTDLDGQARSLAGHGYVVLAYSARGFGSSGGDIHLDSLKYEVKDGSRLIDFLGGRPEVTHAAGQPVVGVAGSSYGGALALMLGATDQRVAAVAADITWNDLSRALFPNNAAGPGRVFKKLWSGLLFSAGFGHPSGPDGAQGIDSSPGSARAGSPDCGRFAPDWCQLYKRAGAGAAVWRDPDAIKLLAESSPATVLSSMRAPTLLTQGEQDSLFTLDQADASAKQIAAAGVQAQVRWRAGGHDAPSGGDDVAGWQRQLFDQQLRRGSKTSFTDSQFLMTQPAAGISAANGRRVNTTLRAAGYPGIAGRGPTPVHPFALAGSAQRISAPAGGNPATISAIPGLGDTLALAGQVGVGSVALTRPPGQTAVFHSEPLIEPTLITGSSAVSLSVTLNTGSPSTGPHATTKPISPAVADRGTGSDVTLFVSLHDVAPDGTDVLPAGLVAPVKLSAVRWGQTVRASVKLPWIVTQIPAGHRIALVVSSTDFGYALPNDPRTYIIALDTGVALDTPSNRAASGVTGPSVTAPSVSAPSLTVPSVRVPSLAVTTVRTGNLRTWLVTAALVVLACGGYLTWQLRRRRASDRGQPDDSTIPIVVTDLFKEYGDGYRAVDGVSFQVEAGQIVGLLGPNGAGKTTTLRVLMGLILPTSGSIRVFGEVVVPGAPVLARLGAFVEGPGFLPHLSGRDNLRLYWAASGRRPEQGEFDAVLEIAGLGDSLDRKVKTYSHGMQQRLAIAQAMLGLPEVLVLDEPANGLDPPQIAEMREVLRQYAASGRTVIVSSHLLSEVEQTCSHVVVMHRGRLVAAGAVSDIVGAGDIQLVVEDPAHAAAVLAAAGVSARTVPTHRSLEDVFLDLIEERHD